MHDLIFNNQAYPGGVTSFCIDNCDKDGAIVSTRIASAAGGVSSNPSILKHPDRFTDKDYFRDIISLLVDHYKVVNNSHLLDRNTVVLSSVHRAALYIAEVLHAYLIPLQVISFAENIDQALKSSVLSIAGSDYGWSGIWQWNKAWGPSDFPQNFIDLLKGARQLVIVRSTEKDVDCPVIGKIGDLYINESMKRLNPRLWEKVSKTDLCENYKDSQLHQWEWGLPDITVNSVKSLWTSLGKALTDFYLIENETINLYKLIPLIWEEYLFENMLKIRGITLNGYWTAHPAYERSAGLIPVHFYRFSSMKETAHYYIKKYLKTKTSEKNLCVFATEAGCPSNSVEISKFLMEAAIQEKAWLSYGYDSKDAICKDIFGEYIPKPFEKVRECLKTSPYINHSWSPLQIGTINELANKLSNH